MVNEVYRISQELDFDCVDGDFMDCTSITLGYVADEFFAQEFCNAHENCTYGPVILDKYPGYLRSKMISDIDDVILLKIPVKNYMED